MHALVLLGINQYTKCEVPSFTNYKDMIPAKLKQESLLLLRDSLDAEAQRVLNILRYSEMLV